MLRARIHRHAYLVLLALLGGCMVTSVWASNLVWVLLGVNWLFEGRWREKWAMARSSRLLQAIMVLCLLYIAGLLWTANPGHGMDVLRVKLPLLIVPLVVLTSQPVVGRQRQTILWLYAGTVLVVSIIALVRLLTIPELPYRDAVPYISHIRFALNCCMVIYILVEGGRRKAEVRKWGAVGYRILLIVWMLAFLALIRSYTAFAILAVVSLVVVLCCYRRWPLVVLWVLIAGGVSLLVLREAKSYYRLIPAATEPLPACTPAGHPYQHYRDGIIENGNYINNYLCPDEMRAEWHRRSTVPYDSVGAEGYSLQPTLVRFLNARGLTKDSVGVWALTPDDISLVEHGVANPVYVQRNLLRKMVYIMLFEREYYVHTHAVSGFTMLQRLQLWQATLDIIKAHPWTGVGTGDVDDALHARLAQMDSPLASGTKSTHNQYLAILAAFGIPAALVLLVFFLRALRIRRPKSGAQRSALMLAWVLTILISFLTEDTLNTLAGILFCTWFLAFRPSQEE